MPIILFTLSSSISHEYQEKISVLSLKSFDLLLNNESIVQKENTFFSSCVQDILSKLICMSKYENNMDIRLLALTCLNEMSCKLPPNKIIQHQSKNT
jgi:hypothetical protein